jgi:hypothetical protein
VTSKSDETGMFTKDEDVFFVPATREAIYSLPHINPELAFESILLLPGIAPVDFIRVIE